MFSLMAPIPLVLRFTHPFLSFSLSLVLFLFKPRTFIKKVSSQGLQGWRPNTGMKMGQEVRGRRKADKGIGERNFLLPAARDLLRGPPSSLSHPPWLSTVPRPLASSFPHPFARVQSGDPFAHAEADVLYDCGVGCTGNNYASVKRDATPAMEGPQRVRSL